MDSCTSEQALRREAIPADGWLASGVAIFARTWDVPPVGSTNGGRSTDTLPTAICSTARVRRTRRRTSCRRTWLRWWPPCGATDIIARHVCGGEVIENLHTLDHYSHAVWLTQHPDQSSATTRAHLLKNWADLGLPQIHQFDHEGAFCGGPTHPHIIGQVVRRCLCCGVEPWFTPVYEAKRNYQIETFHSLWVKSFWSRHRFRNLAHGQGEAPFFRHGYHYHYRPPALEGKTPAQMRRGVPIVRLTANLRRLIPEGRLPITVGRIHLMRKVNSAGDIELLNDRWRVGPKWIGEYVRATINTAEQSITFWHQPAAQADWHLIKTRCFRINEPVHDLLPAFRRNRTRCRDY